MSEKKFSSYMLHMGPLYDMISKYRPLSGKWRFKHNKKNNNKTQKVREGMFFFRYVYLRLKMNNYKADKIKLTKKRNGGLEKGTKNLDRILLQRKETKLTLPNWNKYINKRVQF